MRRQAYFFVWGMMMASLRKKPRSVAVEQATYRVSTDADHSCVRLALDAIKAALQTDPRAVPSISELSRDTGVSVRGLQRHFAKVLGSSPQAMVLQLRLAAVRQTLVKGAVRTVVQ